MQRFYDVAEMKRTMEALNTAQHKAAAVLYRAANTGGGAEPEDAPTSVSPSPSASLSAEHYRLAARRLAKMPELAAGSEHADEVVDGALAAGDVARTERCGLRENGERPLLELAAVVLEEDESGGHG